MASGNGAQVAFAKLNSLMSAVDTVNLWGNLVSETMEHKLEEIAEASINGRRDQPNSYKGIDHGVGDLQFEPNPNFVGHILKAWFGTSTSSTVTAVTSTGANSTTYAGAQVSFHRFQPSNTAFSSLTFLDPYQLMVYRDVGSAWIFRGMIMPSLKFDIKAGALVKATAQFMSRKVDLIQRTATIQSIVSSGGRPWVWDMASIELSTDTTTANLAANGKFEEISIALDMPNTGVSLLDGTKNYGEFVPTDFRKINISGTMSFRDQTDYLTFKNYEAVRMRLTMLNVNSALMLGNPNSLDATAFLGYFGLRFHFPQLKFTQWSATVPGPNRITAKFAAKAEYNEAEGFSALADLVNIVTSNQLTSTY